MKFANIDKSLWAKRIWWLVLVILMAIFIVRRHDALLGGTATMVDVVIFLVWISLLLAPLFREVNIFGVNLKKEIDSLRTETKGQILDLRSDIQNSISLQTEINQQINIGPWQLPPDGKLSSIKDTVAAQLPARPQTVSKEPIQIPEFVQYALSTRYMLEEEFRRILSKLEVGVSTSIPLRGPHSMLLFLRREELITREVYDAIVTVLSICNTVIHGGDFSKEQSQFVKDVAPSLIEKLRAIKSD